MKLKKVVALLLSLAVMLTSISLLCVSVSAVEVQTQIDIDDEVSTYELNGVTYTVIRSVDEMNAAATANANGGAHYILDADLDYTDATYTQINLYNGSLNGNGHSITGVHLALTKDAGNNIAMFKFTNGGTVKISNLTIGAPGNPVSVTCTDDSWATNGSCRIGTLFGYFQGTATIENVTVYSNVSANGDFRAGGFIGEARSKVTMKNCAFNGSVVVTGNANEAISVAGLLGNTWSLTVNMENCANYGTVTYAGYAGGLVGQMSNTATLTNCANYGAVNGGKSGGLIADSGLKVTGKVTMTDCFNVGAVNGTTYAAGLIGGCSKRTDYPTVMTNCANIGIVTSDTLAADLIAKIETPAALTVVDSGSFGTANAFAITKKAADETATDTATTAADALDFMQTYCGYAMFGIEENKIVVKTVPAEAKFLQYKTDAETNKMDIRVIGVLNTTELENYTNVGFNVTIYDANGEAPELLMVCDPQTTTTVYTSVKANEGNTITEYSAADLGATYLYTLELRNIPMSGSYIFEITAFATEAADAIVSDSGITVTVTNGVIQ